MERYGHILIFSAIWAFFYLVASSCVASLWHVPAAPTVFGFLTCPLYIALVGIHFHKTKRTICFIDILFLASLEDGA